ncbi:MAG: 3-deoxy-D-manno-octulosonic acid transferase [Planctomycetota bacterium]|jgi:3-deoxy-D-manno-octulosonic-acid transferase
MRFLIDFVYLLTAAAISPVVIYRVIRHRRYRTGWAQRFGKIRRRHPDKKCMWLHAVSVGEVNATRTIVKELQNQFSEIEIVISSTTDTGFARAKALYGRELSVFFFPLDLSCVMRRAFENIRPSLCLLMELEVWPNFMQLAHKLNVPVVIVNGRITDRSCARYRKIKPVARHVFQKVDLILAQTGEYARRFIEIGCPGERVIVTGSLKYDTAHIADTVEAAETLAEQLKLGDEPLWVAGGTGNDEETIILDVYQQLKQQDRFSKLRLVIVPRKPERFDEVAQLIAEAGLDLLRYSLVKDAPKPPTDKTPVIVGDTQPSHSERNEVERRISTLPVILGDTMGDLRKFYSLATIIFVGRSLVPMGGSDMIEAAALAKPCLFGPHTFNFTQTVEALLEGDGAILVKDEQGLLEAMQKCLSDSSHAQQIAQNGREVIRKNQGATQKTIDQIKKLLSAAD